MQGMARAAERARPGRRLALFLAIYLGLTALIAWRLVTVQVVSADEYRELAQRQTQREIELPPRRGTILERGGDPLAISVPAAAVYANPRALESAELDPSFVASDLSEVLGVPMGSLMEDLTRDSGFAYLGRQLPRELGEQVKEMRLAGIGVLEEPRRTYPSATLASQVVGFAGIDGEGLSGTEAAFEEDLSGSPGMLRQERAPGGVTISSAPQEVEAAEPGKDVMLTIDGRMQHNAERLLADVVEAHDALGASAVVLDVETGEVLVMASTPGYDPSEIGAASQYERRNRAVTDVFEPGSVAKAVTVAAALEEGVTTPDRVVTVPDSVTVGNKRFRDSTAKAERDLSVTEITAESSNVGTIQLAQQLGEDTLHDYLGRFGLGRSPELGFPGESAGLLPGLDQWYSTSLPTIAIGQGVSASLLQVAGVFETIATGGEWVQPSFVHAVADANGQLSPVAEGARERAISEGTAAEVAEMLAAVVTEGTGQAAAVPGYSVAGKTGTAQKPSETERGYEEGAYIATFAGFAPVEDPQLVAAIMVDEPQDDYYGGDVAAPMFAELMEFSLSHRRVAPTEGENAAKPTMGPTDDREQGDT